MAAIFLTPYSSRFTALTSLLTSQFSHLQHVRSQGMVFGVLCEVCEDVSLRAFQLIASTLITSKSLPSRSAFLLYTPHFSHLTLHSSRLTPLFPHFLPPAFQTLQCLVTSQSSDISPTPQLSHFCQFSHVHCEHNSSTHQHLVYNYKHMQSVQYIM